MRLRVRALQGVLLCGGTSSRMGYPKGLLPRGDTTLGLYLGGLLQSVCGRPPILLGDGAIGKLPDTWLRLADVPAAKGPLAGLLRLAEATYRQHVLVLAVDMAAMNRAALTWLIGRAPHVPPHQHALWPKFPARSFGEPLAAIYFPRALTMMAEAWQAGECAVHRAMPQQRRMEPMIPAEHQPAFTGVNTPQEWHALTGNWPPDGSSSDSV